MKRTILLATLICFAPLAAALTPEQLEAARQAAAARAAAAAGLDLSGGPSGPAGGGQVAGATDYCIRRSASGGISLLGVQSGPGPSTQGVAPAARLANEHPAKQRLIALGWELGMYQDPPNAAPDVVARNAAARARADLAGTFQFYVDALASGDVVLADLFGWVHSGDMARMAAAHKEYEAIRKLYASAKIDADAHGSQCP